MEIQDPDESMTVQTPTPESRFPIPNPQWSQKLGKLGSGDCGVVDCGSLELTVEVE